MNAQRRTDLCTCGRPRGDACHDVKMAFTHSFMPHPQPPALAETAEPSSISAYRAYGVWIATARNTAPTPFGRGQAASMIDAINAAIEDLKEKTS